jgi:multidrug efflux pump subunit AcrB
MGFVLVAMRRPVTVLVAILGIVLAAILTIGRTPIDLFPNLNLPVIYVAQPYGGLDPAQMEGYVASYYEYHFLYITGIKEVESKSIQGVSLIKLQFQPDTNMSQALSETVSYVNRARAFMPPGTVPPFIVRFDAGSVPVGQLVFSSPSRSVGEIQDLALFKVRPLFASLPGVSAPPPIGGNQRTIVIQVDPERLRSYAMSPDDVVKAVAAGNTITPSGNVRIGDLNRLSPINSVVSDPQELASLPIRSGAGPTVFLRDVALVKDGTDTLAGYGLVDGHRSVYIPVTKRADASTWAVVQAVKAALPGMRDVLPDDVKVSFAFDQSGYVRNALVGLLTEGGLGAILTGLVVLLFLRNWKSALIVVVTIPVSLLSALIALRLSGQTLNLMTLGGLALSVGVLVDQATVAIENVHRHLELETGRARAVLNSSREIVSPVLLATLCLLAVFVPSGFMSGVPRALFLPLSLSVGFAVVASFGLSQTLVPVLSTWLLTEPGFSHAPTRFERMRDRYAAALRPLFRFKGAIAAGYLVVALLLVVLLARSVGTELFPDSNATQLRLRLRAATGTRVERTEVLTRRALDVVEREIGPERVATSIAYVGTQPTSYPVNTVYLWTSGSHEAVLSISLKEPSPDAMDGLKDRLRRRLHEALPDLAVSFEPGDLVGQVMSLGAPTPVEIAIVGKNLDDSRAYAERIRAQLEKLPYLRDLQFGQPLDYPTVDVRVDRERAGQLGLTMEQVGKSFTVTTSSSRFTQPNYWLDRSKGTTYQVQVEVPPARVGNLADLANLPAVSGTSAGPYLRDMARVSFGTTVGEYDRLNNMRMLTLTANLSGHDLGSAARDIQAAIRAAGAAPKGAKLKVRGQIALMLDTLSELQTGLAIAVLAVFILLAAYFQSFRQALVVVSAVPAVLAGVLLMLLATGTTLNIQSYMGAIMAIGVALANAILLVSVAETERRASASPAEAALAAVRSRMRPILMTSLAMVAGMVPMALGLGEGGDQSAPLGRAVIGGLLAATGATLALLPLVFSVVQGSAKVASVSLDPDDPDSLHFEDRPIAEAVGRV